MAKPPSAFRRQFAARLAAARTLAGYDDAKAFAQKALGIEPQRYRRWERAETEPGLEWLIRISDVTGVSLDQLIRGVEPPKPERRPPQVGRVINLRAPQVTARGPKSR